MLEAWHAGQLVGAVLIGFLRAKSRRKARKSARANACLACFAGLGKKPPSFGEAACRDTIILRSTHARLHRRTRPRRHQRKIARARDLAQSISRLHHYHAISRILLRLPQDRAPRLRHHHHPIHAQKRLHRAESVEDVSPRLPQPGHLLRKRRQQNPARRRRSRSSRMVRGARRIHSARRPNHLHLCPLARDPSARQGKKVRLGVGGWELEVRRRGPHPLKRRTPKGAPANSRAYPAQLAAKRTPAPRLASNSTLLRWRGPPMNLSQLSFSSV